MKRHLIVLLVAGLVGVSGPVSAVTLSEFWHNRNGIADTQRHQYPQAISNFETALKTAKGTAKTDLIFNQGSAEFAAGKFDDAARHLQLSVMNTDPIRRSDSFYQMALNDLKSNKQSDAIGHLKSALIDNPNHSAARQTLLQVLKMPPKSPQNKPQPGSKPDSAPKQQLLNKIAQKEAQAKRDKDQKERQKAGTQRTIEW